MPAFERPEWREPILVEPVRSNGRLLGAFLTTFDPPDAALLVQDLLPAWLGLSNSYTDEGADKLRFYAELEDELKRLHRRFTIISSPGRQETGAHGWIWDYISRLQTGFTHAAVQHAKLWMFHREGGAGEPQTLELIVSSQNLTQSGFRQQVQAGWRCTVSLEESPQDASWGVLPAFLDELAKACGPAGSSTLSYWQRLLERAVCPKGITFLASIPGRHPVEPEEGDPAWGVAALRRLGGSRGRSLTVMTPTIGNWDAGSLIKWAEIAGIRGSAFNIVWLDSGHPWASQWQLNAPSESALNKAVNWLQLPAPLDTSAWTSPLCREHRYSDTRWSHAKIYELSSTAARQLLCTSANFSRAAWGTPRSDGKITIDNFELGVAFRADAGLSRLPLSDTFTRATCEPDFETRGDSAVAWMAAEWDGKTLRIQVRLAEGETLLPEVRVRTSQNSRTLSPAMFAGPSGTIRFGWLSANHDVPLRVQLITTGGETFEMTVERPRSGELTEWLSGAGSQEEIQDAADQMLEERYDFFEQSKAPPPKPKDPGARSGASAASYSVAAYEDSRRRFAAIDHWAEALGNAGSWTRASVLADGERIAKRWEIAARQRSRADIAISASLAAEELFGRIAMHREPQ